MKVINIFRGKKPNPIPDDMRQAIIDALVADRQVIFINSLEADTARLKYAFQGLKRSVVSQLAR